MMLTPRTYRCNINNFRPVISGNILFPSLPGDNGENRRLLLPCLEGQTKLFFLSECNRDFSTYLQTYGLSKFRKGIYTDGLDFLSSAVQVSSF